MSERKGIAALFAAAVLAGAAGPAAAAEVGLGGAITNGGSDAGTTVMLPIRPTGWLIEPQLTFVDSKAGNSTNKVYAPAAGVYLTKEIGPLFEMYYGGIIGWSVSKQSAGGGPETKTTSLTLQPTIGVQHYLSKQFSLGVDAGLQYTTGTAKTSGLADQDVRNWSTVARILVRAYFF